MAKLRVAAVVAGLSASLLSSAALAQTEITWWHAMGGELGTKLEEIVAGYNASQTAYHVTPIFKGTYAETMTAAIAAFRAGEQPDIVQVFEVGTGTMMAAEGAIYPVYQLMADTGQDFDPSGYLSAVVGYYTDTEGNMLSMPFNSSTPVLYYNKTVFEKAGLDPNVPPATWEEVEAYSKKIVESGAAKCGFTTGWISWIQTENLSAWHNQPIGTLENGFGGLEAELTVNGPLQVKHWTNLKRWLEEGLYQYGGPEGGNDAPPKFYAQECAMIMNSSASRAGVLNNSKDFEVGIAMLPHYADTEPQNSIIGGATLWVLQGRPAAEYKGVAKFLTFLSSPEVQAQWHQQTGYVPITLAAAKLTEESGFYKKNPGRDIAVKELTLHEPTENSKGLRIGNFVQIRDVVDEELENVWSGKKDAKTALDEAVKRGNELLRKFEAANK